MIKNSVKRNAHKRFESSGKWMRSLDDFYALDFMDGNNSGYYSPDKAPDYCSIECFIDEDDGCFCVCYEDIDVDAIVDDFFNSVHLDRNPVRRKGIREFTDEDIQEFVADCIQSGDFSQTDGDSEILWSERDNSWAYDDMIASLDACAREQEQKILDAERYACQLIMRGKLEMSRESNSRQKNASLATARHGRRNKVNEGSTSELDTLKTVVKAMVNRASLRTDILSLKLKDVEYTGNLGVCEDLLITLTLGLNVSMDEGSYYRALKGNDYSPMSNDVEIVIELDPREGFDVTYRTHDVGSKSYSLTASGTYQEAYITEYPERASYSYLLSDDIEHDLLNAIYGAIEHGEKHRYYVNFGRNESRQTRRSREVRTPRR